MAPAGWYQVSEHPSHLRWWDGTQWTRYRVAPVGREGTGPRRTVVIALPLVLVSTIACAVAEVLWGRSSVSLFLWQLCVGIPIGAALVIGPVCIVAKMVRPVALIVVTEVLMALLIVWISRWVVLDGAVHSTSGLLLLYIPICGSLLALAAAGVTRLWPKAARH